MSTLDNKALFVIGNIDFTSNIKVPTYKVNRVPLADAWMDAYYVTHQSIVRHRISGEFTMYFADRDSYINFLNAIEASKLSDGSIPATFYANNTNMQYPSNYFISFEAEGILPIIGIKEYDGMTVQIEER